MCIRDRGSSRAPPAPRPKWATLSPLASGHSAVILGTTTTREVLTMVDTAAAQAPSNAGAFRVVANPSPMPEAEREAALADLKFGTQFTDHMARITWTRDGGWGDYRVEPYGPLTLDPAAAVLHYAQEIFEGLKAYRWADGSVWLFRPTANAERFNRSARRMALPELPVEDFLNSVTSLLSSTPGTQALSTASSDVTEFRKSSTGSSGSAMRRADRLKRSALAVGRNSHTEPSAQRY